MDENDIDEISFLLKSREKYLFKIDMDDICNYDGWHDFLFNNYVKVDICSDVSPFDNEFIL